MNKAIIGLLATTVQPPADSAFFSVRRQISNDAYVQSIERAGGQPIIIPVSANTDEDSIKSILALVQGIVVPGGADIDPSFYGEPLHPLTGKTDRATDAFHLAAIKIASRCGLPILGICRGVQALNVAFGGTLWQDVSLHPGTRSADHYQRTLFSEGSHRVDVAPDTRLAKILQDTALMVNSFHHQGVARVASGFSVTATTSEGLVEAIEVDDPGQWIVGVQWHPEVMDQGEGSPMGRLFKAFVAVAAR